MLTDDFIEDSHLWVRETEFEHRRIVAMLSYDPDEQRAYERTYDLLRQTYEYGIASLHAMAAADAESYEIIAMEESLLRVRGTIGMIMGRVCARPAINVAPEGFGRRLTVFMYAPRPAEADEEAEEDTFSFEDGDVFVYGTHPDDEDDEQDGETLFIRSL
jgi:hypothetical protein